jgi:hypothetical protein
VQPCAAGFWSVDFGTVEPVEIEPQPDPAAEEKPASGSPGPELLAEVINRPIEEMRAAKEENVDVALANAHLDGLPPFLKREPETAEETAAREQRMKGYAKQSRGERELIVRKTPAPKAGACQEAAPTEAKSGSKIAAVIEKAKTTGITMAQVREMTGWSKTGGFYGAIKRAGLTLTKDANGVYHAA